MEMLFMLFVIIVVIWGLKVRFGSNSPSTISVSASAPRQQSQRAKPSPTSQEQTYSAKLERILEIETKDLGLKWRMEPASDKQINRLNEIVSESDIQIPKNPTKGQASDVIGLFFDIEEETQAVLKFFKVKGISKLNQTEARYAVFELLKSAENSEKWKNRPASTEQKDQIRFFGGKVPKGITLNDAAKIVDQLAVSNETLLDRWDELRGSYEEMIDRDNRECYEIKRFSWKQFCDVAIEKEESAGQSLSDILLDEEKLYEALLEKYPALSCE
jgi:hypothetical protein